MTLRTSASILTSGRGTLTSRLTEMNGIRKRNAPVSHKESTSEPWIQRPEEFGSERNIFPRTHNMKARFFITKISSLLSEHQKKFRKS